jgi:hypothetical protein
MLHCKKRPRAAIGRVAADLGAALPLCADRDGWAQEGDTCGPGFEIRRGFEIW